MTVTSTEISYISPYTVSDTGTFTTAMFNYFLSITQSRVNDECSGMSTVDFDYCHALLICHEYAARKADLELKSFSSEGYSESKEPGKTSFLVKYEEKVKQHWARTANAGYANLNTNRCDRGIFPIDQNPLKVVEEVDATDENTDEAEERP